MATLLELIGAKGEGVLTARSQADSSKGVARNPSRNVPVPPVANPPTVVAIPDEIDATEPAKVRLSWEQMRAKVFRQEERVKASMIKQTGAVKQAKQGKKKKFAPPAKQSSGQKMAAPIAPVVSLPKVISNQSVCPSPQTIVKRSTSPKARAKARVHNLKKLKFGWVDSMIANWPKPAPTPSKHVYVQIISIPMGGASRRRR